jgi:enterochelin esterase-like enzyme
MAAGAGDEGDLVAEEPVAEAAAGEAPAGENRARPSLAQRRRVPGRALVARSSVPEPGTRPDGRPGQASRRRFLLTGAGVVAGVAALGAGGVGAVNEGWLPGRRRLVQAVEGCGTPGVPPPAVPGPVTTTSYRSAARGREVSLVVAYPPGYTPGIAGSGSPVSGQAAAGSAGSGSALGGALPPLPVVLALHGRGGQARDLVDMLAGPTYLAAATAAGVPPFVLAGVDGGETYWHRRADGDDPETMILDEVLPRLAADGLRTDRFGVLGWSMGGYGALLLARRHPTGVVAAAASSPAVWSSFHDAAPGAFDSAADLDAHRVLGTRPAPGVAYRIACGNADEFSDVSHRLASQLAAQRDFTVGCHDGGTWRRHLPGHLAFLGAALPS